MAKYIVKGSGATADMDFDNLKDARRFAYFRVMILAYKKSKVISNGKLIGYAEYQAGIIIWVRAGNKYAYDRLYKDGSIRALKSPIESRER